MSSISSLRLRGAAAEAGLVKLTREEELLKMVIAELDWYKKFTDLLTKIIFTGKKMIMKSEERKHLRTFFTNTIRTHSLLCDIMEWLDTNKSRGNEENLIKERRLRTEDELVCVWNKLSTSAVKDRLFEFVKEPLQRHKTTPPPPPPPPPQTTLDSNIISKTDGSSLTKSSEGSTKSPVLTKKINSSEEDGETITKKRKLFHSGEDGSTRTKSSADRLKDIYKILREHSEEYKDEDDDDDIFAD